MSVVAIAAMPDENSSAASARSSAASVCLDSDDRRDCRTASRGYLSDRPSL